MMNKPDNPYAGIRECRPYRASLHNHTIKGRSTVSPVAALSLYRCLDVPVVALTDHDRRIPAIQGKETPPAAGMVTWIDDDFHSPYQDAVLIRGFEASFPEDHVNILGCRPQQLALAPADPGYLEAVHALQGFAVINHPSRWNREPEHVTGNPNLSACDGLEIYNGGRSGRGLENADATPLWDACLSAGLRLWALANPDCHTYDFTAASRPDNGWNVLWLPSLDEASVFEALRCGRFYASNGLEVSGIECLDDRLRVEAPDASRIRFTGAGGRVLKETAGPVAEYAFRGGEGYVRATCESDRIVFAPAGVPARAWLQPIRIAG